MKTNEEKRLEQVWNQAELLERVDNDQDLLIELLTIFREDFPRTLQSLQEAVTSHNLKNCASLSHTLKGMLSNLGGTRAAFSAASLEKLSSASASQPLLQDAFDALRREAASLASELEGYMAGVRR